MKYMYLESIKYNIIVFNIKTNQTKEPGQDNPMLNLLISEGYPEDDYTEAVDDREDGQGPSVQPQSPILHPSLVCLLTRVNLLINIMEYQYI